MTYDKDFNNLACQEQEFENILVHFSVYNQDRLKEACAFAKERHGEQKRDDGIPYVIHPLRMAITLIRDVELHDVDLIIAALCHDVVEDTGTTHEEINEKFGERVASLVKDLTRDRANEETEEEKKINKPKKFAWYIEEGPQDAAIIKAADVLDNFRSMAFIQEGDKAEEKFSRWFAEAKTYYIPLAEKAHPILLQLISHQMDEYKESERFQKYF